MRKNFFLIILLFFASCQKEELFSEEYDLIQGKWILDSYERTDIYASGTSVFSANALNHEMKITIRQNEIVVYLENTEVKNINLINDVEFSTGVYSGVQYQFFRIVYKDGLNVSKEILFSYTADDDLLHLYYSVRFNNGSEPHYVFNFRRI